ncbi:MAG: hypothetical protein CMJ20_06250 [Phycisphaeraceae bacterium]|nr:hypothetical protein [Phycisphaeraceae bacterium]|tara:strand:+ start:473 stop:2542 length:2070 start_codon:yes stop_codon:yes gene_type:complete
MLHLPTLWLSAIGLIVGLPPIQANGGPDMPDMDLPVTNIVLFSSGVGYFSHKTTVDQDATLRLMLKTDQINDALKSMIMIDHDGGHVTSATYPSNNPIERALGSFGVDISGNPTLPVLLNQLRGAQVSIAAPDQIDGSILNVHNRTEIAGDPPVTITSHVLTLVTSTGIRSMPMDSIDHIELTNPVLRNELNKALALLATSRDTERKPLDIHCTGTGLRRVEVGYVIQTPVWKTSYRLDLSGNTPLLQGWAIVENTSSNDWNNVELSLASGRPVSFTQDLYTPLYIDRPEVKPNLFSSLRPRAHEEGSKQSKTDQNTHKHAREHRMRTAGKLMDHEEPDFNARNLIASNASSEQDTPRKITFQEIAETGSIGELFRYTLKHPVDMPRRRSAMLPIIHELVNARKVSIYNQQQLAKHPLNGVLLTNNTDLTMLAGPVTIFDAGAYAGDAQIEHLVPGDNRLLSYAVDLNVTIDPSRQSSSRITSVNIINGVAQISKLTNHIQKYLIKNKAGDESTARHVIIEHPYHDNRKLVEPSDPLEQTTTHYRFEVTADPGTTTELTVSEQETTHQSVHIARESVDTLLWYMKQGEISKKVREAIAKAVTLKNELSDLEHVHRELKKKQTRIKNGQERLRQNLRTVQHSSALGKRYLAKLNTEEDEIEQLESIIISTKSQVDAKRRELSTDIQNINL